MTFSFLTGNGIEMLDYPYPTFLSEDAPAFVKLNKAGAFGNILFNDNTNEHTAVLYRQYKLSAITEIRFSTGLPLFFILINLGNEFQYNVKGLGDFTFHKEQLNMFSLPDVEITLKFNIGEFSMMFICFDLHYFRNLNILIPLPLSVMTSIENITAISLFSENIEAGPGILQVIRDTLSCEMEGKLRIMYLEAKSIELLSLVLKRLFSQHKHSGKFLKQHHIEKLHATREMIINNYDVSITLKMISREVGMNDFILKKGFKVLFGITIHDYIVDVRMRKAQQLLVETDRTITDIALSVGYSSISNFSSAFRKKFGYAPSSVKTQLMDLSSYHK